MRNIPVLNHRLDESNGTVEHVLKMKVKKTPWYLRFAPKAKGIVSFVQNLLSPLTQKEGVRGGQLSAFFQPAAAVVAGVVGVGLLASPFLVLGNDEETNDAPEVSCLWVANFGSIGFKVDFDVSHPSDSDELIAGFCLEQDGQFADDALWVESARLRSSYCDWLEIPGFDGSTSTAPIGSHSFDFTIDSLEILPSGFDLLDGVVSSVSVSLYVDVNSNGSLRSMSAYAYDSDGDSYEIPVYYSAGGWGGSFGTF